MYYIQADEIQERIKELGREISKDYRDTTPVFITLLKGAFIFLADLVRELSIPHEIDFITLSSYRDGYERSSIIEINNLVRKDIKDRDIIIVDEIVDTGRTLSRLIRSMNLDESNSLKVCTLLNKKSGREVNIPLDYVGFSIPDVFVIGYGLDFKEHYRNLSFITELTPDLEKLCGKGDPRSLTEIELKNAEKII